MEEMPSPVGQESLHSGEQFESQGVLQRVEGDAVNIWRNNNFYYGPVGKHCPVCLSFRYEHFQCARCGKQVCEHCRDSVRANWCKRCANDRREIRLQFLAPLNQPYSWRAEITTDLLDGVEYKRTFDWLLVEQNPAIPNGWKDQDTEDTKLDQAGFAIPETWDNASIDEDNIEEKVTELRTEEAEESFIHNFVLPDPLPSNFLFGISFPDSIWSELQVSFKREMLDGNGVRIRLIDLPPALVELPWEEMVFEGQWNAKDQKLHILRGLPEERTTVLGKIASPLRVLVLVLEENDPDAAIDQTDKIPVAFATLQEGLYEWIEKGKLSLELLSISETVLKSPDPDEKVRDVLRSAIQDAGYHILQIIGDIRIQDDEQQLWATMGHAAMFSPMQMSLLLQDSAFQLVLWSGGCIVQDEWQSIFKSQHILLPFLQQNQAVGVLAPRHKVAPIFLRQFEIQIYGNLLQKNSLESALSGARRYFAGYADQEMAKAWSIPCLMMRDWEGTFLDFQVEDVKPQEQFEPFIKERLDEINPEEGPDCMSRIAVELLASHFHIIFGDIDVDPYEVGRLSIYPFVHGSASTLVLRYPRYEPIKDFIYHSRRLPPESYVLLDAPNITVIGSEIDAILDFIQQHKLYLVVTSTMLLNESDDTPLTKWLKNHPHHYTRVNEKNYSGEALRQVLARQAEVAFKSGRLSTVVYQELLKFTATPEAFKPIDTIKLPGQITRLLGGPLTNLTKMPSKKELNDILHEVAAAPETLLRWFSNELDFGEKILVMAISLLPGLPVHLLNPI